MDINGKVAVVTGGSSGIGLAIAGFLADAGAKVVLVARRQDRLDAAVQQICDTGGMASRVVADLNQRNTVIETAEHCTHAFGAPNILVNAAGVNLREHADNVTPESWDQTIYLNLSIPFFLAQALVQRGELGCERAAGAAPVP